MDGDWPAVTLPQLRALAEFSAGLSYAEIGGSRQAGYQVLRRLELSLFPDDPGRRLVAVGGAELTPLGERVAEHAKNVVDEFDRFVEHSRRLGITESVVVTCSPAVVPLVDLAWNEWAEGFDHREVVLRDVTDSHRSDGGEQLVESVRLGRADIALVAGAPVTTEGVEWTELYKWPLVAVVPPGHSYEGRRRLALEKLTSDQSPILVSPRGHVSRELLAAAVERGQLSSSPNIAFESPSVELLVERANAGRGIALVPGDSLPVRRYAPGKRLPQLTASGRQISGTVGVCSRTSRAAHVDDFLRVVKHLAGSYVRR